MEGRGLRWRGANTGGQGQWQTGAVLSVRGGAIACGGDVDEIMISSIMTGDFNWTLTNIEVVLFTTIFLNYN